MCVCVRACVCVHACVCVCESNKRQSAINTPHHTGRKGTTCLLNFAVLPNDFGLAAKCLRPATKKRCDQLPFVANLPRPFGRNGSASCKNASLPSPFRFPAQTGRRDLAKSIFPSLSLYVPLVVSVLGFFLPSGRAGRRRGGGGRPFCA